MSGSPGDERSIYRGQYLAAERRLTSMEYDARNAGAGLRARLRALLSPRAAKPPEPEPPLDRRSLAAWIAAARRDGSLLRLEGDAIGLICFDREGGWRWPWKDQNLQAIASSAWPGESFRSTGTDPMLVFDAVSWPVGLRPRTLMLELRHDGARPASAQLFWAAAGEPFSEASSVRVPLLADGEMHTYSVNLSRVPWPAQPPGRMRLDPIEHKGELSIGFAGFLMDLPRSAPGNLRQRLADRFLAGRGLEIGALLNPLPVPAAAKVRYVDRLTLAQAREHYPELAGVPLVDPSVIADADDLRGVVDSASEDFVICNHVFEHMRNPLAALQEWLRVLRKGGHLYLAIPDHVNPLDDRRATTTFEHLLHHFQEPARNDAEDAFHFTDWTQSVHRAMDASAQREMAQKLQATGYSIHYHVFDQALFARVLAYASQHFAARVVELVRQETSDGDEHIAVLRRG
jgi:SAM-dependent methyltransferase